MRVRELEALISEASSWTPSDIDQRSRVLREAELLPRGGRGPHAPSITPEHAAFVFIALAAPVAAQAADTVKLYRSMKNTDGMSVARSFGAALTALLADPANAATVEEVVICEAMPQARIIFRDGISNFAAGKIKDRPQAYRNAVVTGNIIREIAQQLADDRSEDGEWTPSV